MDCQYACGSAEHFSRRTFLHGAAGALGALSFGGMVQAKAADQLASQQKRCVVFWLSGGASQLETWDPKPDTDTGGPFRAIPTSVPGLHISELLPYTAQQMHRLAVVRSINTQENNHAKGAYIMQTGRRESPAEKYPHLGSVCAKLLAAEDSPLPGYIHVTPRGESGFNRGDAAFLGPRFASVTLADGNPPPNLLRPPTLTELADAERQDIRNRVNSRFAQGRRSADTEAYTGSYDQAAQVMARRDLFDLGRD